jgi:hypothetical protein
LVTAQASGDGIQSLVGYFETFGINPKTDRISQFAGIRTDEALNFLDDQMFYCKPPNDCLPYPEACAVANIRPQLGDTWQFFKPSLSPARTRFKEIPHWAKIGFC